MCGKSSVVSRDLYKQLSHPLRRRIVYLLGSMDQMSASKLMSELGIPAGNFYYHLNFINPLITRKKDGLYALNELGRSTYKQYLSDIVSDNTTISSRQLPNRFLDFICLSRITSVNHNILGVIIALLLSFEFSLYYNFNIMPMGFFISSIHTSSFTDIILGYSAGFILFMLVLSAQLRVLKKSLSSTYMAMIYVIAEIPLAIFGAVVSSLISYKVGILIINTLFLCFQVWLVTILTSHLSKSINSTLTSAIQIVLPCIYTNLTVIFFLAPYSLVF